MAREFYHRSVDYVVRAARHTRTVEIVGHLGRAVQSDFGDALEKSLATIKSIKPPQASPENSEAGATNTKLDKAIRITEAALAGMQLAKVIYEANKRRRSARSSDHQ